MEFSLSWLPATEAVTPVESLTEVDGRLELGSVVPAPKLNTWKPLSPPTCKIVFEAKRAAGVDQLGLRGLLVDIHLHADLAGGAEIGLIDLQVGDRRAAGGAAGGDVAERAGRIGSPGRRRRSRR